MTQMLFKPIVEEAIHKSFSTFMSSERQLEIERIGKYWNYYYGFQEPYIKQYEGETDADYQDKDKMIFNYTKLCIDEYISGVFGKRFDVKIPDQKYQDMWNNIMSPMSFFNKSPFFAKVQRIAEVSDTCVVMIRWDDINKRVYFEEIRGEFVAFIPDKANPKKIGTLIISYTYDTGEINQLDRFKKRIEIWNDENWAIWEHNRGRDQTEMVDMGENPYGFIPAVKFQPEEDDNTFYGITNMNSIVRVNESYNNLWTALMSTSIMQSFSVLVTRSESDIDIKVSPKSFINFENSDSGEAKYITPSPRINEVEKVLMDLRNELQDFTRIPTYAFSSSKDIPISGYALTIKRIPIEQLWGQRKLSYGQSLTTLVRLSLVVNQINTGEIPDDDISVEIDFSETEQILTVSEQILIDERDIRYGLISPVDLMLRRNPDLTREEAIEIIERNKEELQRLTVDQFDQESFNQQPGQGLGERIGEQEPEGQFVEGQ